MSSSSANRGVRRHPLTPWLFLLPTLLVMGTFQFFPMVSAFGLSLFDYFPGSENNRFVGFTNFVRLFYDPMFWEALTNSVLYLLVVPAIVVCSLALAALVEPRIPFINFFRAAYYLPVVTMMVVVAYAWSLIFATDNGLLNQALQKAGVIGDDGIPWLASERLALWTIMTVTLWKGLGYYMVMFIVGLKAVPRELVEASRIDGASAWQVFTNVKLPLLWPTITIVFIISSVAALQVFEEIYMMTRGRVGTSTLVYEIYTTGFDMGRGTIEMGYACAIGVVLFILVFGFTAFALRRMEGVYST